VTASTLHRICNAVSGPVMMQHMREFARWTKHAGTAEELQSLRYMQARFDEYGFRTEMLLHDAYISLPGAARVVVDGQALTCITHSHSRPTPPGGIGGELAYLGAGREADFAAQDVRGRIVLVDGIATPAVARLASRTGAVGQVQISPHQYLHEMCISPVWGSPTHETLAQLPTTVVCTVSQHDGAALRERLARGQRPDVVLHAEVDTGWRTTPILVAEMAAPHTSNEAPYVLFSGHHDTWYYGVMDNGGANATTLEVSRLCAQHVAEWRRGLRVCVWSGHSQGRYSGSAWYADQYWDDLDRRCVAHVNVDSTGGAGNTVVANTTAAYELAALAAEAVREQGGQEFAGRRVGRAGDESFWGIGIPAMFGNMSDQPPGGPRTSHGTGWWWHTPHDTLDKIDETVLVRDTRIYAHTVWRLLRDEVLPLDFAAHARKLLAELRSLGEGLADRFELGPLVVRAQDLLDKAQSLNALAAGTPNRTTRERINRTLMELSRALVPVDYASGDRFGQDPALPQPAWQLLQPLRRLAAMPPQSDAAKFLTVAMTRARNHVAHALRQANAAMDSCFADLAAH
jgi:N-acetylated-alpha-linked acidic dipeptidase